MALAESDLNRFAKGSRRAPQNPRLAELAAKAGAGDWTAFTEFKKLTRRFVLEQLACCGIQEQDDRLDLAADVYMTAWRSLNRWRPDHAFTNLINTAAKVGRKSFWTILTRTAPVRHDDDLDVWPSRLPPQTVPGDKAGCDWKAVSVSLPPSMRDALLARESGLSPDQISSKLGISLVEVWDRILEAEAAALKIAGLPVVNRWLERQLKKHDLLPANAAPFPCDIGWMIRHMIPRMRETAYARISCRGIDVPAVWGVKVPTFNNRLSVLKHRLRRYAIAAGALPVPPNVEAVSIWLIADSIDLGVGSTFLYAAAEWAGLPRKSDYTWAEARLIWDAAVASSAYSRML